MPSPFTVHQLGAVCTFVGGGTPSRTIPAYFAGEIPWATVKDFKQFRITDTVEHITEEAIVDSATNLVDPGTVLLVSRVGLGKVAIAGARLAINQDIKALTPNKDILPEYLFWFLLSKAPDIERMGAGATVKGITLNDIKSIQIPVPPLPEQRRIVDLLSRAEGIVSLRREAEKKAAELIPALFINEFSGLDGSNYRRAEELCEFITKGTTPKASEIKMSDEGNSVPFLKVLHIEDDGRIDFGRQPSFVSQDLHKKLLARSLVKPNDVLMNIVGPPLGRICLVSDSYPEWNINQALAIFRPKSALLPAYLFHALRSPFVLPKILQLPVGVRQLNISLEQCRNILIPVPAIRDQVRFVERASAISALQSLQAAATSKAQATFDALLAAAFQY